MQPYRLELTTTTNEDWERGSMFQGGENTGVPGKKSEATNRIEI